MTSTGSTGAPCGDSKSPEQDATTATTAEFWPNEKKTGGKTKGDLKVIYIKAGQRPALYTLQLTKSSDLLPRIRELVKERSFLENLSIRADLSLLYPGYPEDRPANLYLHQFGWRIHGDAVIFKFGPAPEPTEDEQHEEKDGEKGKEKEGGDDEELFDCTEDDIKDLPTTFKNDAIRREEFRHQQEQMFGARAIFIDKLTGAVSGDPAPSGDSDGQSASPASSSAASRSGRAPRICVNCKKTDGKLSTCSGCQAVRYCSVDCQRAHRGVHKPDCQKKSS